MSNEANFREVYFLFEAEAERLAKVGRKHYGAHGIMEHLRFEAAVQNKSEDGFKVCNTYEPLLARLFVLRHPRMPPLFDIKQSKFDDFANWPSYALDILPPGFDRGKK